MRITLLALVLASLPALSLADDVTTLVVPVAASGQTRQVTTDQVSPVVESPVVESPAPESPASPASTSAVGAPDDKAIAVPTQENDATETTPTESAADTASVPPVDQVAMDTTVATPPETLPAPIPPVVDSPPLPSDIRSGAEVFARLRARLSQPACPESDSVQRWRKRYAGQPVVFARNLANILPLLDFVTSEVEASGLPGEFVLIPLIESWYRPDAIGSGGPTGMWQMIASTARNHGIHIRAGYDGRLSPVESTRAALSYLKTLHGMFGGDWQAAMMAYNAGEYRLLKAFKRDGARTVSAQQRKPHGLSNITYDYIFKLQALACLITEPQRQGLALPDEIRFNTLAPVLIAAEAGSLEQVARDVGIDARLLHRLNPGYRGGRIVTGVPRMVLMPASVVPIKQVVIADAESSAPMPASAGNAGAAGEGRHQVKRGDTLFAIARRYGLSLERLLKLNGLGRNTIIHAGQSLKVLP